MFYKLKKKLGIIGVTCKLIHCDVYSELFYSVFMAAESYLILSWSLVESPWPNLFKIIL